MEIVQNIHSFHKYTWNINVPGTVYSCGAQQCKKQIEEKGNLLVGNQRQDIGHSIVAYVEKALGVTVGMVFIVKAEKKTKEKKQKRNQFILEEQVIPGLRQSQKNESGVSNQPEMGKCSKNVGTRQLYPKELEGSFTQSWGQLEHQLIKIRHDQNPLNNG